MLYKSTEGSGQENYVKIRKLRIISRLEGAAVRSGPACPHGINQNQNFPYIHATIEKHWAIIRVVPEMVK